MSMPPYFVETDYDGNGVYQALVTFSMPGEWQVMVDVTVAGAHRQFMYVFNVD